MNTDIYELIEKIIDTKVEGADTYMNKGSRWLIFTDAKKWIFELTKEGTLWYNFYFFQRIFKLISLDVVENQHHITKWVENFIQNGVKSTQAGNGFIDFEVGDTIQSGVKETKHNPFEDGLAMEEAIQIGVKRTELGGKDRKIDEIKDIVENGIKETKSIHIHNGESIDSVIQDGVKETYGQKHRPLSLGDVIQNGIKETQWRKVDNFPEFEERVIENGIKETWGYEKQPQIRVNEVINYGEKHYL